MSAGGECPTCLRLREQIARCDLLREGHAEISLARGQEIDRLRAALEEIIDEAQRQVMRGERVEYATASEPIGVRGGIITTRVGDLCDMRRAIENIARGALR